MLGVVVLLALVAGLAVAWHLAKQPAADIHNGASAFFSDPPTTTQTETTAPAATHKKKPFQGEPPWPMYGYNVARTRDASAFRQIKPPFHTVWKRKTFGILEYPPSFADGILYLATDSGWTQAIDARTGEPVWTRRLGAGLANEAALSKTMMYVGSHDGHVYALSRKTGKIIWKTKVGSEVECSQLYYRGRVYSGSHSGQVRAMDAKTGHILWTFQASGEVKSGLSTADGWLYFGSRRAGGHGKDDIWRARERHGRWSVENLGPEFNTADNESEFQPAPNGRWGLLSTDQGLVRVVATAHGWHREQPFANQNGSEIGPLIAPDSHSFIFSRDAGDGASGELFLAQPPGGVGWAPGCPAR